MSIEQSISSIQSASFMNSTARFGNSEEAFHDVFQRALNDRSSSRPPKVEVAGILVPVGHLSSGRRYRYRLESDLGEFTLKMSAALEFLARRVEWEEVTVKGYLESDCNVIEVEKLKANKTNDLLKPYSSHEAYLDADFFAKSIAQFGKLEPALDFIGTKRVDG